MANKWLHHLCEDDDEALIRFIAAGEQSLAVLFINNRHPEWQSAIVPLDVKTAEDGVYVVKARDEEWKL